MSKDLRGSSRHVSTRASRARHVEPVEPCYSKSLTQPKCMGSKLGTSNVSRRDVTSQVELKHFCLHDTSAPSALGGPLKIYTP